MKTFLIALIAALVTSTAAVAATQQEKMRTCNAEAKSQALKGEDRRAFMSQCLAVTPEEKQERLALKEKTKSCNAEARAKSIKGEERKQFITQCMAA